MVAVHFTIIVYIRWIQEGFKGVSAEAPKPHSGSFTDLPKMLSDDFSCIMAKQKFVL